MGGEEASDMTSESTSHTTPVSEPAPAPDSSTEPAPRLVVGAALVADLTNPSGVLATQRPAPPEATRLESFTTPMNNVRCSLDEKAVNCTIFTYDYVSPPGCEGEPANYTVGLTGTTTAGCSTQVSTAKEVPYGSVVAAHGFACTADQYAGISCWSELTGHGFTVRRAAEEVF